MVNYEQILSARVKEVQPSGIRRFFELAAKMPHAISLGVGEPDFETPWQIRRAGIQSLEKGQTFYTSNWGLAELRNQIAALVRRKYRLCYDADKEILVTVGGSEAIDNTIRAIVNVGDEVLIPEPSFVCYKPLTQMAGGVPVPLPTRAEDQFKLTADSLRAAITPRTKLLILPYPNNPTGAVYGKEVLLAIAEIARQHHLVILADEIYDRLVMDGLRHESIGALAPDLPCVTFNGLSKSHIVCGFRCGWMVFSGPKGELDAVKDGVMQLASMRLCGNALTQLVIPAALVDSESTHEMLVPGGRLFEQRKATLEALDKIDGVDYVTNHAAFYLFPRLDKSKFDFENAHDFAMKFLHEQHVLVIPGGGFDWHEDLRFRIVMLPEPETLTKAMGDMAYFLKQHRI